MRLLLIGLLLLGQLGSGAETESGIPAPSRLRCEYLADPLGIDVEQPRLSWVLPSPSSSQPGAQTAYQILVASSAANLQKDLGDLWNSGKVTSADSVFVPYAGKSLTSGMRGHWKVRVWNESGKASAWSRPALWSMGLLRESDWQGRWIGLPRPADTPEKTPLPFPWLRKVVEVKQKPGRATAYVNAQGYYELYINGRKVGDDVLAPVVSDFSKRNIYVTYDVTDYLTPGKNCIALWLGRGWYVRGHPGVIHDGPIVRAQIDMIGPGGAVDQIRTDETWKSHASHLSPLGRGTAFGDYGGERYDARLEVPGWNTVAFDDSSWQPVASFTPPPAVTAAQMAQPNRIMETIKPKRVEESAPGVYMVEMERAFTGWFTLRIPANLPAGSLVKLEYADFPPTATRFQTNNQRDEIVVKGGAPLTFRSRFNYHAFGWVRITGLKRAPVLSELTGNLIHTAYEPAGDFESSNDLLNRIYRTVNWTFRSLSLGGYVVDCPHRERLGYGGDAGTSIETGMFNFATGALYNRWSADWRAAQDPSGDLPYTAPNYQDQGGGGPMWSGFSVTLPWQLYVQYGDRRALQTNYPTIQKWLEFAHSKTSGGVLKFYKSYGMTMPQWNFLGDWVTPRVQGQPDVSRDTVSAELINNLHYLYTLDLASRIATILGRESDASMYSTRAAELRRTLHQTFYNSTTGVYAGGQQPYLAFPLLLGVPPQELRPAIQKTLEETILVKDRGHINAGMHGVYFLLKYLMESDQNDLIYAMATKTDFPSWGNMLRLGATTIWENWSGGSHIHDTLISVGSWFIQGIGGIQIDEKAPGFKHFWVKPGVGGGLTFARARYESPYGEIVSHWRLESGKLRLDVTVPRGTTATIGMPTSAPDAVTVGRGIKAAGVQGGRALFDVGPGRHTLTAPFSGK